MCREKIMKENRSENREEEMAPRTTSVPGDLPVSVPQEGGATQFLS